jgi:hypothetical protein
MVLTQGSPVTWRFWRTGGWPAAGRTARSSFGQATERAHLARARKLDLKTWPGPVVAFYLKGIDANGVMAAARSGDAKTQTRS